MDDVYPQIIDFLKHKDDFLLDIYKLTKDHHMKAMGEHGRTLDMIHKLVSDKLTLQQRLECYTQREIDCAIQSKDFHDKCEIKLLAFKGQRDLIQLLKQLGRVPE
jgi:hypothetical protein